LDITLSPQDPLLLIGAHTALGQTLLYLGEFIQCREHKAQANAYHVPYQSNAYRAIYGIDPGVLSKCGEARALWLLGYPDQSRRMIDTALNLAQKNANPRTLANTLYHVAYLHHPFRESQKTLERAEVCIAQCQEHGFASEREWSIILRGWGIA